MAQALAGARHAVEVERGEVRLYQSQQRSEAIEMFLPVVKIAIELPPEAGNKVRLSRSARDEN